MYPLKFSKVLKEKVWGGRAFESFLGLSLPPGKNYGESWEVSAHPNGPSVVEGGPWAGKTLIELTQTYGPKLIGEAHWERFNGKFPLLIKYLDINDKLSIQVHPENEYALKHEGEWGKSECWYILQASSDAKLILGMAPGVTQETFRERSSRGQWDGLFQEVSVKTGDFVHVTPGTVHASLTGSVLICEIQQNSDTTYRIYDFDRLENGQLRPLHLDKALEVIRFDEAARVTSAAARTPKKYVGAHVEELVRDPFYCVDKMEVEGVYSERSMDAFKVFSILDGVGAFEHLGDTYPFQAGETWFIPAGLVTTLEGKFTAIKSWVEPVHLNKT